MGKRIITPSDILLDDLDERLSCRGLRRLGTPYDNCILIGRVCEDFDGISLPKVKDGEQYIIGTGSHDLRVIIRNIEINHGLVFANIIAMDAYTAFELESLPFSIILNSRIKDNVLMITGAKVVTHQPKFYRE